MLSNNIQEWIYYLKKYNKTNKKNEKSKSIVYALHLIDEKLEFESQPFKYSFI